MIKFDRNSHDGLVILSSDRRIGVWASQSNFTGSKTVRQAGQLPASSSAHTLQLVALSAALRSVTKAQATFLTQKASCYITKPRVLVVTADPTFADALRAVFSRDVTLATAPFKAGRNFLVMAAQQVSRFDLTVETLQSFEEKAILILRSWAEQHIFSPKMVANLSPSLCPTSVSQVM